MTINKHILNALSSQSLINPNEGQSHTQIGVWRSIIKGDVPRFESAISNGALSIDEPLNKYGWTALHAACYYGQIQIVDILVKHLHADVNKVNCNGWHSLIFAVIGGHLDVIDFLLFETQVEIYARDANDVSALIIAQQHNDTDILQLFQDKLSSESTSSSITFDDE